MNAGPDLYICSSRRHLYVATGLALESRRSSHLLVVDQASDAPDPIVSAIAAEPGLFSSVTVWAKRSGRRGLRRELADIADLVARVRPATVSGGNDRKFQFQYAVRQARALDPTCRGIYLDDGTGTYESGIHLQFWRGLMDRTVVAWAKKISIGTWYCRSRYFGATPWVDECRVQHPALLPAVVRARKRVTALDPETFKRPDAAELLERCFIGRRVTDDRWKDCAAIVVLPLGKQFVRSGGDIVRFATQIRAVTRGHSPVGIKYHPREVRPYLPADAGDILVDQHIPAEILFSRGQPRLIVGDTSSALLSAQWLQTRADIVSLCPQAELERPLPSLLARAGVRVQPYA